jgi:hypothetical protein
MATTPTPNTDLTLSNLIPLTTVVGLHKVIDYWKPFDPGEIWRTWKTSHENLHIPPQLNLHPLQEHLAARKIPSQQGKDILRWGHSTTGAFNISEAYYIKAGHKTLPREEVWGKIWDMKTWPKINTFLWLVAHNNILTWDNLRKRGFIGPSWCHLCGQEEETQNHLLNLCPYSSCIWDHSASIMRTSDRNRTGLKETIEGWRSSTYQSPILNRIWQLLPGFILWNIWKERNGRIFKSITRSWQEVWNTIQTNINETLSLQQWTEQDLTPPPNEFHILKDGKSISLPPLKDQ